MWLCVCLLGCGLQLATGCTGTSSPISCSPGESALLPCKEKSSQDVDIEWQYSTSSASDPKDLVSLNSSKNQHYKGRIQIYTNHSLSITELTAEDAGRYWCSKKSYTDLSISGCSVSENKISVEISRYSGESVLLNCSVKCSGAQYSANQSRWKLPKQREIKPNVNSRELNQLYQGRAQIFDFSLGNLSLLISNVIEEDEGLYSCWINENQHKNFNLTIKGCTLSETEVEPKTKYPGDSVLLSCSCTDPKTKPKNFTWIHIDSNETEVSNETSHYKGRIHTFQKTTPSNLSLLISSLSEEDQGMYRCTINNYISTQTNITVKGCVLSGPNVINISCTAGQSVLLPCSCNDDKTKPNHFEWKRADLNRTIVSDTEDIKVRFKMFMRESSNNLSLLISDLTDEDQGWYVCTVNGKQTININLTVTGNGGYESKQDYIKKILILICLVVLFVLGASGCICWRYKRAHRERSRESQVIQRTDEDDVTYSTVMQIIDRKPAERQQENDVTYAAIALDKRPKTEDDVTYSSLVHSNSHRARIHINSEDASVYASVRTDKQ